MSDDQLPPKDHNEPPFEELMTETHKDLLDRLQRLAAMTTDSVADLRPGEKKPPVINTDAQVMTIAPLAKEARALFGLLEKEREKEKAPHLKAGRETDAFFGSHKDRAKRIYETLENLASDFQTRKIAAERAAAQAEAKKREDAAEKLRQDAEKAKRPETSERKIQQAEQEERLADAAIADASASNAALGGVRQDGKTVATARTQWVATVTDFDVIPLEKLRPYLDRAAVDKALKAYVKIHKGSSEIPGVTFTEQAKTQFR